MSDSVEHKIEHCLDIILIGKDITISDKIIAHTKPTPITIEEMSFL